MPLHWFAPLNVARSVTVALAMTLLLIPSFDGAHAAPFSQSHEFEFASDSLELIESDDGAQWRLDGGTVLQVPGRPALPVDAALYVVPRGLRATDARLVDAQWVDVGTMEIAPALDVVSSDGEIAAVPAWAQSESWTRGETFPPQALRLSETERMQGFSLASVEIFPVRQLADGRVQRLARGRVEFDLDFDERAPDTVRRRVAWPGLADDDADFIRRVVRNPEDVQRHAPPRGVDPSVADVDMSVLQRSLARTPRLYSGPIEFAIVTVPEFAGEMQRPRGFPHGRRHSHRRRHPR